MHIQSAALGSKTLVWQALVPQGRPLSFGEVFAGWRTSPQFCRDWVRALRGLPWGAYCWECPGLTRDRLDRTFECVFISSPLLGDSIASAERFAAHFTSAATVIFPSLGGDTVLVAPCPKVDGADRAHLGRFMSTAAEDVSASFWHTVGVALETRLGDVPVWLSTAGLGVAWLHVRLDSRPKYYRHTPYKQVAA